jgi:hypothetical protein
LENDRYYKIKDFRRQFTKINEAVRYEKIVNYAPFALCNCAFNWCIACGSVA